MTDRTVKIGQIWADKDKREVAKGTRQRLRVADIYGITALLRNDETGVERWVDMDAMTPFERRFRLVEDGAGDPPSPTDEADALRQVLLDRGILGVYDDEVGIEVDYESLVEYIAEREERARISERMEWSPE